MGHGDRLGCRGVLTPWCAAQPEMQVAAKRGRGAGPVRNGVQANGNSSDVAAGAPARRSSAGRFRPSGEHQVPQRVPPRSPAGQPRGRVQGATGEDVAVGLRTKNDEMQMDWVVVHSHSCH